MCHLESICDKLGVFWSVLDNIFGKKNNVSLAKVLLSNGALLGLDNEQSKQNLLWLEFSFVVKNHSNVSNKHFFQCDRSKFNTFSSL